MKYVKGDRICDIGNLTHNDFVFYRHKLYHKGWWQNWQFRRVMYDFEQGNFYYAIPQELLDNIKEKNND